jgi:REP element-mobilizing transposase RayT
MKFDPKIHHRRSIRLPGYDYTRAGVYSITIVTRGREEFFGAVVDGEMKLNQCGQIVDHAWQDLPNHYPHVELDVFCIMPNHVHGIIILKDDDAGVGAGLRPAPTRPAPTRPAPTEPTPARPAPTGPTPAGPAPTRHSLFEIVRAFKSFSARRINALQASHGTPVWQRNYYEHIIRNNEDYLAKSNYILDNPLNWEKDDENPNRYNL